MSTKEAFGLKYEHRLYKCTLCGHETRIGTNHTSSCYNYCKGCSWKSVAFGPGMRMFGSVLRKFACAEVTVVKVNQVIVK